MEAVLTKCVEKSLQQFTLKNAIFLCERLVAEFPSEVNLQLLARCYLSNNQAYCAYHILKGTQMDLSRYLFALSCFKMDLLSEAEAALLHSKESDAEVPNGAAGHHLLGLIYRFTDRGKNSVEHFHKALSIDPLFWAAYEELCTLGAAEEATAVFDEAIIPFVQEHYLGQGSSYSNPASEDRSSGTGRSFGTEVFNPRQLKHVQGSLRNINGNHFGEAITAQPSRHSGSGGLSNPSVCSTPSPMPTQLSDTVPPPLCRNVQLNSSVRQGKCSQMCVSWAPRKKIADEGRLEKYSAGLKLLLPSSSSGDFCRPGSSDARFYHETTEEYEISSNSFNPHNNHVPTRLFSDSVPRRSPRLAAVSKYTNTSKVAGSGNNCLHTSSSKSKSIPSLVDDGRSENCDEGKWSEASDDACSYGTANASSESSCSNGRCLQPEVTRKKLSTPITSSSTITSGISDVFGLLRLFGEGFRLLNLYRCQDALDVYKKLSQKQYNTGWVQSQVGKAYLELVDYLNADHAFSLARRVCPYIVEGMDMYSTVLYHLKEDMKLSYLAQDLISIDRLAPQSWCAMGNCYSLMKEHETALKNFRRALQLNPRFAYAHTLCGHEYTAMEEYENGVKCYRKALHVNARHYNSWYGLGMIYLRQEKFDFAEHHFRQAFRTNPYSSVIMCYLGTALHSLKRTEEALEMMERAIITDKRNPVPVYQKANILVSIGNFDGAMEVLKELQECTPCESSVHALMGQIYKQLKMYEKAILHLGIALDLKPPISDVTTIKVAIESLTIPDEIEDNL